MIGHTVAVGITRVLAQRNAQAGHRLPGVVALVFEDGARFADLVLLVARLEQQAVAAAEALLEAQAGVRAEGTDAFAEEVHAGAMSTQGQERLEAGRAAVVGTTREHLQADADAGALVVASIARLQRAEIRAQFEREVISEGPDGLQAAGEAGIEIGLVGQHRAERRPQRPAVVTDFSSRSGADRNDGQRLDRGCCRRSSLRGDILGAGDCRSHSHQHAKYA